MQSNKKTVVGLFVVIIAIMNTVMAINLSWAEFEKGKWPTVLNFRVSIAFLIVWFLLSIYLGASKDKRYYKFLLVYWGINITTNILNWIALKTQGAGILILLPFSVWYGAPLYGLGYLLNTNRASFVLISAPSGMLTCILGYGLGILLNKILRFKKFTSG